MIESRWLVDDVQLLSKLSVDDQMRVARGESVTLPNYNLENWHPHLYIENSIGEMKERIAYSARRFRHDKFIYVCEHRHVRGTFWEKLELDHFPSDIQDLSISITSMFYNDTVLLLVDPRGPSRVNREAFVDQQEWSLYEHVNTEERFVEETIYHGLKDDEENTEQTAIEDRQRSIVTVTCHAGRVFKFHQKSKFIFQAIHLF